MARPPELETQTLDERAIIRQLQALRNRCAERFPTRGLTQTIGHLLDMAHPASRNATSLRKTHWPLRILSFAAIGTAIAGLMKVAEFYEITLGGQSNATEFTQAVEAALNIILLSGVFIVFFVTLENRFKRTKALNGLYKLRAIAHVIDMHQLTKDPGWVAGNQPTASSPVRDLTDDQLLRYLDYCSEALSLTGKLAALYAQYFPDATVVSAVNDIEELTTNLSRKIWQKIMLLQTVKTGEMQL
ncbi:MAG: hypothetical protein KTR19_12345 [Hyphomicrobiales bacterium]|nr:hypothetical protein [Hyphomicrobiales bacterium]